MPDARHTTANGRPQSAGHILVTDDDKAFRLATRTLLEDEGYRVTLAMNAEEALAALSDQDIDLLLSDLVMEKMSGIELLRQVRQRSPELPVIMVTGFGSIQTAVEAMRLGATDYLTKPSNNEELRIKVQRALEARRKDRELASLREELQGTYSFGALVTRNPKMFETIRLVRQVADTDVTVLIRGESGTGKELIARALHFNSTRRDGPFVAVNCSALPENLLESELFGYEKGAFTGALRQHAGKFEEANGGTLFLDEIGDMSLTVQAKLLRVLQEKTFQRIGGKGSITVDSRVVAATNRNLDMMLLQGDFREDLFYRLNVFPLALPPLRERLEDIPLLAEQFLARHGDLAGSRVKQFAPHVLARMMNYPWRGNIRELENLIKRAIIKASGDTILDLELPQEAGDAVAERAPLREVAPEIPFRDYMGAIVRDAEERYLRRILRSTRGNINQIAKLMEVDRKTVYRKLAEYSIDPAAFRE